MQDALHEHLFRRLTELYDAEDGQSAKALQEVPAAHVSYAALGLRRDLWAAEAHLQDAIARAATFEMEVRSRLSERVLPMRVRAHRVCESLSCSHAVRRPATSARARQSTPAGKCRCIQRSLALVAEAVAAHQPPGTSGSDATVTTDDMLPLLLHLLVVTPATQRFLHTSQVYMREFLLPELAATELGCATRGRPAPPSGRGGGSP